MKKLLVIDNYDSFTFNLVQMFRKHNLEIKVCRADRITINDAEKYMPDYILISPGPKNPLYSGISIPVIKNFYMRIPVLGVCLGMQCINEVFSGKTVRASEPVHGKTCKIYHKGKDLFSGIPSPFIAARYHSLIIKKSDNILVKTAESKDGIIMGIAHKEYPLSGVQFHPESFMTEFGCHIIENFLRAYV